MEEVFQHFREVGERLGNSGGPDIASEIEEFTSLWWTYQGGQDHREAQAIFEGLGQLQGASDLCDAVGAVTETIGRILADDPSSVSGVGAEVKKSIECDPSQTWSHAVSVAVEKCRKALGAPPDGIAAQRVRRTLVRLADTVLRIPEDPEDRFKWIMGSSLADLKGQMLVNLRASQSRMPFLLPELMGMNPALAPLDSIWWKLMRWGQTLDDSAQNLFFLGLHLAFLIDAPWIPESFIRADQRVALKTFEYRPEPGPDEWQDTEDVADCLGQNVQSALDSLDLLGAVPQYSSASSNAEWARGCHEILCKQFPVIEGREKLRIEADDTREVLVMTRETAGERREIHPSSPDIGWDRFKERIGVLLVRLRSDLQSHRMGQIQAMDIGWTEYQKIGSPRADSLVGTARKEMSLIRGILRDQAKGWLVLSKADKKRKGVRLNGKALQGEWTIELVGF
jgi:hypothetical protein